MGLSIFYYLYFDSAKRVKRALIDCFSFGSIVFFHYRIVYVINNVLDNCHKKP